MNHPVPILLYHRIDESESASSISPAIFRQHLAWLKEQGWESLSCAEFTSIITSGRRVPNKSFLLTFDDGYESIRSAALDILREFSFHAICFLSTGFLRGVRSNPASRGITATPDWYLSWDQARELQSSGLIDCQSHSHTHGKFSGFSLDAIEQDLALSVDLLSDELNLPRNHFIHFAWPWGLSLPDWRMIATRAGFTHQYGVARQSFRSDAHFQQIPRTCFDAQSFARFQRQIWLQTGQLSLLWDFIYPHGQKVRRALKPRQHAASAG